ncbi:MAG: carbohydrate binding family 9 domain-containing protein, partial [Acidobacteria bacterium]|nr:carbohydrate binding family 9 domain-containing protein [Acidobacteriota bacterium]
MRPFPQDCAAVRDITWFLALVLIPASAWASSDISAPRPVVRIPRVSQPPALEDYLDMMPSPAAEGHLAKIEGFKQRTPRDGEPPNQRTDVYLGYDDKNFYAIFVAFDSDPHKVRARMTTRDKISDDERLDMFLDTFNDNRHAYVFTCNPFGIQLDGRWDEGSRQQYDSSFDTVWSSRGKLTDRGFVIWMKVPFKSLRFPPTPKQTWGILFIRWIPRLNGSDAWPQASTRVEGRLNQAATLEGLENISPGRNAQIIPYGFMRSFRALDTRDPNNPHFVTDGFDPDAGVDAKLVFKDSLVLDVAVNPDFSQVESDEPQVTVNQRFEVFFPEKRPFFLENSSFFETPINLFFTRRVADPQYGIRLTGKKGPYAIGALFADDESPGKIVPPIDPVFGKRAHFGIFRVQRDIFKQSTLGVMVTDREFAGGFNRVGGLDTRLKLTKNWVTTLQAVASSTELADGSKLAGPAYKARLRHTGYQFFYNLDYDDRSPAFVTDTGFLADQVVEGFVFRARDIPRPFLRTDVRSVAQFVTYRFRPEGKRFISWGPSLFLNPVWDHQGTRLDL